jgi:hypothetical protein
MPQNELGWWGGWWLIAETSSKKRHACKSKQKVGTSYGASETVERTESPNDELHFFSLLHIRFA